MFQFEEPRVRVDPEPRPSVDLQTNGRKSPEPATETTEGKKCHSLGNIIFIVWKRNFTRKMHW